MGENILAKAKAKPEPLPTPQGRRGTTKRAEWSSRALRQVGSGAREVTGEKSHRVF